MKTYNIGLFDDKLKVLGYSTEKTYNIGLLSEINNKRKPELEALVKYLVDRYGNHLVFGQFVIIDHEVEYPYHSGDTCSLRFIYSTYKKPSEHMRSLLCAIAEAFMNGVCFGGGDIELKEMKQDCG